MERLDFGRATNEVQAAKEDMDAAYVKGDSPKNQHLME